MPDTLGQINLSVKEWLIEENERARGEILPCFRSNLIAASLPLGSLMDLSARTLQFILATSAEEPQSYSVLEPYFRESEGKCRCLL